MGYAQIVYYAIMSDFNNRNLNSMQSSLPPGSHQQNGTIIMRYDFMDFIYEVSLKGCRMDRSDKVSLWYVSLLINTRFRFFYFIISNCLAHLMLH